MSQHRLMTRWIATTVVAVVASFDAWGQSIPKVIRRAVIPVRTLPLDVHSRPAPQLVQTDDADERVMAYVVVVTSWAEYDLTFALIDVEDASSGAVLASFDQKALEDPARLRITQWITTEPSPANLVLPAGRSAVIYVVVPVAAGSSPPKAVRHRFTFEPDDELVMVRDDGSFTDDLVAVSEPVSVNQAQVPVLGPPLEGGPWRCTGSLHLGNAHSAIYPFRTTQMRVPQFFGCDMQKVDSGGNVLPSPFPDDITASMFYSYGANLLAVADGTVVVAQDGIPEHVPQVDGHTPFQVTNANVSGNWIALDIGGGLHAFYAHIQPGTLRVKVGDKVRAGQVLGLLGMSGNASGPHLHFHVGNGPSLNGNDGVPFVFREHVFGGRSVPDETATRRVNMCLPVRDSLVTFPQ
jgi:hypothetical protein